MAIAAERRVSGSDVFINLIEYPFARTYQETGVPVLDLPPRLRQSNFTGFENGYAPGGALTWFILHKRVFQLTVSTGVGPPGGEQIDAVNRVLATLKIRED
jgi:hypothetical protein